MHEVPRLNRLSGPCNMKHPEFSETPNPAYFYAYFCFCTRKISFRGFSFTLYCHRTSNRASVKRTYDVYYALRLPPDVQIELQRRTADFRNFFCPSEIDTRDVQKLSKGPPTFNQLYDVCPAYLPEIRYLC